MGIQTNPEALGVDSNLKPHLRKSHQLSEGFQEKYVLEEKKKLMVKRYAAKTVFVESNVACIFDRAVDGV